MRLTFPVVLWSVLVATTPAQVCLNGVLEPVGGPTICQQGETHLVSGTRVYLRSRTVDLNRWNGQLVRIEGSDISVTCRVLDVTQVTLPTAVLRLCGSPSPGCPVKLTVGPGAIGQWLLFGSFQQGYQPFGCTFPVDGTLLLGGAISTVSGGMFGGPSGDTVIFIPLNPALVGLRVLFQGARQDIGPIGPPQLTNVELLVLSPFMPPCQPLNC